MSVEDRKLEVVFVNENNLISSTGSSAKDLETEELLIAA